MMWHSMLGSDPSAVAGAKLDRALLRRVWRFARPYRWMLLGFLSSLVAAALLDLVPPLLFRTIIDDILPSGDTGRLTVVALLVIGAAVGAALLSLVERWWSSRIGEGLIFDLRSSLFDHVQRMPMAFFTRTQTGALTSRLNNDVIGAQRALTGTLGSVVSNAITLLTTLAALLVLDWRLTLLAVLLLPVFILPAKRVGRLLQRITRQSMDLNASMNATMTERFNVAGAQVVKLFGDHDEEARLFSERAGRVRDIGVRSALYSRIFMVALTLVGAVGTATVYWVGGRQVISGELTTGTLVAMAALVVRVYGPLTQLTNARVDLMTAFVSFERVFEVLDATNPIEDAPGARELARPRGRIELDHVRFRYPAPDESFVPSLEAAAPLGPEGPLVPRGDVLRDVSAVVEPGQLVAVVGPSGAGKTTLVSLIPRLWDVTGGAVRIDGHDVRELTQASLRRAIGVVSQDPHLFHDSIEANLRYAKPSATVEELHAACRAARIHDAIERLPEGYATLVGERGYRLSGGEKQRLAIARMLLKDPAIVILDEATSHLDSENEAAVQAALAEALRGRTAVVIAHRLSTTTGAQQILVVDDGRVVERGTHGELLAGDGLYADLYRTLLRQQSEPVA